MSHTMSQVSQSCPNVPPYQHCPIDQIFTSVSRSELAHKEDYSTSIDNKQKIIIFIFIFVFIFTFILTLLTNLEHNNLLAEKLLFFATNTRIATANSLTFVRYI